jgi:hypothetical protein
MTVRTEEDEYFAERAEVQLELAQRADHPKAVAAHYELVQSYLARAYPETEPATVTKAEPAVPAWQEDVTRP